MPIAISGTLLPFVCRVKDKVRRLARHHKVFLSDVTKLNDNLERAKGEARHALEAKKRVLQQARSPCLLVALLPSAGRSSTSA
jgi:hypothetical protein